jgi:hypothetical protein
MAPIEVEAVWIGVQFDNDAQTQGLRNNGIDI